jgi:hypothetical protein
MLLQGLPFVKLWMQRLVSSAASGVLLCNSSPVCVPACFDTCRQGLGGQPGSGVLEFGGLRLRHVMTEGLSQAGCSPCQERTHFQSQRISIPRIQQLHSRRHRRPIPFIH